MDSKLKVTSQDDIISTSDENLVKTKNSETPIKLKSPETSITNIIGSGEDARNSIIYLVLKWAFHSSSSN